MNRVHSGPEGASIPTKRSADVVDILARLEYVKASRDGHAARADRLYVALVEVRDQVETYPLDDTTTCMCGSPVEGHNVGSGHAPVSQADHAISLIVETIDKALGLAAIPDDALLGGVRPDDYEGPDVGMHDTEIDDCNDTEPKEGAWLLSAFIELRDASASLADGPPIVGPITQRVRDAVEAANVILNATDGVATSTCGTKPKAKSTILPPTTVNNKGET